MAVLPVICEIVSAAKTKKQGIKLGNPALQPWPSLGRVQIKAKFPQTCRIVRHQPEFGTGN
jgi:hypothetical protein